MVEYQVATMSRLTKFLENELDRIYDYLGMAKSNLIVISELCDNRMGQITPILEKGESEVIDYLNKELSVLEAKVNESRQIINNFKTYYYNMENPFEINKGRKNSTLYRTGSGEESIESSPDSLNTVNHSG